MMGNKGASARVFATQHARRLHNNGETRGCTTMRLFRGDSAKSLVYSHVAWDKCVSAPYGPSSAFVYDDYLPSSDIVEIRIKRDIEKHRVSDFQYQIY